MTARPTAPLLPSTPAGQSLAAMPCYTSSCGRVMLYLGDCRELQDSIFGVDAVVSDPPYGMNYDTNSTRFSSDRGGNKADWGGIMGDNEPFDPQPWIEYPKCVLFGSNHYAERLPIGTTLVWIKRFDDAFGSFLSDAELAWMKGGHGVYCKRGPMPQSIATNRVHPSQKPVELMAWCMDKAKVPEGATVLDPYMGSGTTGIACLRTGRRFVGIEKDPTHYATALERIKTELAQGDLFHSQHNS